MQPEQGILFIGLQQEHIVFFQWFPARNNYIVIIFHRLNIVNAVIINHKNSG